jgi:hypothetical protein
MFSTVSYFLHDQITNEIFLNLQYTSIRFSRSTVYYSSYIRTNIFPSFRACMTKAANVQIPPRTITVPLNKSAPVNPPSSFVTKAPARGVPVKVL